MKQETPSLDHIDRTIVDQLRRDGRMSIPALAEALGIGRATAYARFNRLLETGVITGFEAKVDHAALGSRVTALLLVSGDQTAWPAMSDQLSATFGVEWAGLCTGQFDFAVLVRAADLGELRDVVLDEVLRTPGVTNVQTSVVLGELVGG